MGLTFEDANFFGEFVGNESKGLSKAQMAQIERWQYSEMKSIGPSEDCPICYDPYQVLDEVLIMPGCSHFVH